MNPTHTNPLVGLFGGSFDPIHYGHLCTAWEVTQSIGLSQCYLIPSANPPHRSDVRTPAKHRYAMLELALQDAPKGPLIASNCELNRQGPSYTIDTIKDFSRELMPAKLCLILGMDAFLGFESWYLWQEILQIVHLIVVHRPDTPRLTPEIQTRFQNQIVDTVLPLRQHAHGLIFFKKVTSLSISATHLRKCFNQSIKPYFLTPTAVIDYIEQNNLYQTS